MKYFFLVYTIFILLFSSCASDNTSETQELYYFDLKGYFGKEAVKLEKKNRLIEKSILHNQNLETQNIKIADWRQEFELFSTSDINKVAWKNSYTKDSTTNKTSYKTNEEGLKTRLVEITYKNHIPVAIKIINKTKNFLFSSTEELYYAPDSLYQINKKQHVFILGDNDYLIKGSLK